MNYKLEMILPIAILAVCSVYFLLALNYSNLNLDIDLKGGTQITGAFIKTVTDSEISNVLSQYNAGVRTATDLAGTQTVFISLDSSVNTTQVVNTLAANNYVFVSEPSIQTVGAALGSSFFQQAVLVLAFAFIFMAITVFIIFRNPVSSSYVVICGVADILETLVVSQIFGIPLSLATFSALLLLLGYSVDTDILLTTRVFKTNEGEVPQRVKGAMKTGLTMIGATIAALAALFLISSSAVITQIASVLLIGLVFDIINTWMFNAPLLRLYMERKTVKK